jgi:hypothetical protein
MQHEVREELFYRVLFQGVNAQHMNADWDNGRFRSYHMPSIRNGS